jgi:hypothetical protein
VYRDSRRAAAGRRLDRVLAALRLAGIPAHGAVYDDSPLPAVKDVLASEGLPFDVTLVLANVTAASPELRDRLLALAEEGPRRFIVVVHGSMGGDRGEPQRGEHAVEATPGRCAARVAVHDVALARLREWRDHRDPDRPTLGTSAQRVDELVPYERLVRDDEHGGRVLRHACTSSCTGSFVGLRIAWRAPGTPYS